MTVTDTKYIVDKKGRKKAVVLNIREYSHLLSRLEELEDTLALDEAVRQKKDFRDYSEIRKELVPPDPRHNEPYL